MKTINSKLFYVSPWLLAAATGLLVLIIVTFAAVNIQREKTLMTNSMLQKATTLMRFVHSGARGSFMTALNNDAWNPGTWDEHVQRIINHVSEDPNVIFLAIVDENGKIIAHNEKKNLNRIMEIPFLEKKNATNTERAILAHRVVLKDGVRTFEAARRFIPYRFTMPPMIMGAGRGMRHNFPMLSNKQLPGQYHSNDEQENLKLKLYIVTGLDMGEFDKSLVRLKMQILILSITMLLVGVGGWLSLTAVQGYRVSQKTLAEIKAFTGYLISKLPVGIIAVNKQGRITTWNKVVTSMTGLPSIQTVGKYPADILPPELKRFFSPTRKPGLLQKDDNEREKEIRMLIAEKEQVIFCQLIDILDNNSIYIGQVLMISNLTELKKMESEMREHEKLAAVGRMAAGVAHEVRNPLSSIKGLALLLKNKFNIDSKESETAALLIQEVERMNRTISELLSFARPPSLNISRVNITELLTESLQLICADTESNGIQTNIQFAPGIYDVSGDHDRLNQVFINILLNAVQAMESGGELIVNVANKKDEENVTIKIIDSGTGINKKNLNQIFYPYFTTKPGGSGIGLAISQKIISDHHGVIKIESEPGQGTTVIVELPAYIKYK